MKCLDEIIKASRGKLSKKEAKDILDEIERRFKAKMPREGMTLARRMEGQRDPASMTTTERMQLAAEEAFTERVKGKAADVKRQELQVSIAAMAQRRVALNGHGVKGVQEYLLKDLAGAITGEKELLMAELYKGLEPFMFMNQGKLSQEQQLAVLTKIMDPDLLQRVGMYPEKATPEETLAYQFRLIENQVFSRKNAAGADVKYMPGHFPQAWDPQSVRHFGLTAMEKLSFRQEWLGGNITQIKRMMSRAQENFVEHVLPLIDRTKYTDRETGALLDDAQTADVLRDVWATLASHGLAGNPDAAAGSTSLAKQLEVHREIHFKDPESFLAANNSFGSRDLFTSMVTNVQRHATELALLEKLGPNPDAGFRTALQYGKSIEADRTTFGREGSTMAEKIFDEITGRTNMIGEDKFDLISRVMQGARNLITSAKLGMLPMSQLVDLATFHAIAKSNGLGAMDEIKAITTFLNPRNKIDRDLAKFHGMLAQSVINDVALRYGDASKGAGWTSKAADATVTWSGAKFWTDAMKQGFQVMTGKHLADYQGKNFLDLDEPFRRMLERNLIGDKEWELIRQSETAEIGGFKVITPVLVSKVTTREGSQFLQKATNVNLEASRQAERFTREVAAKVAAMMNEEADVAVVTPGFKERAIAKWGTKPGEAPGEFMRSIFLFKTFSIAMLTKVLPRIYAEGSAANRASFAAQLLTGMMITGAMAVQLKELAKGRNPRDMTSASFWGASFMQAGGMGIFGDFLLADANRFGGGFVSTVGGPVAGMITDIQKLTVGNAEDALAGKDPHIAADTIQFAKNYTPLMNLWYTRLALDHLLFFHIQEAANPGYLRRMEKRTKKQNSQTFWWNPTDSVPGGR